LRRLEAGWGLKRDFQSPCSGSWSAPAPQVRITGPHAPKSTRHCAGSSGVQVLDRTPESGPLWPIGSSFEVDLTKVDQTHYKLLKSGDP